MGGPSTVTYSVFLLSAIVFSILLNGLLLKFSSTLGIRNSNEPILRWSSNSKPSLGGISFFVVFLLSITSYPYLFEDVTIFRNFQFLGIVIACTIAFIMGLADDAYNTRPFLKFFVQVLCAGILILSDISIHVFQSNWLNYLFTIVWIVGMMNSINMLDNMDAITTSVSITIIISALAIIWLGKNFISTIHVLILIGVLGALVGFLYYNWHPSKLFMGDTGSQFLGVFLGIIGILYFWNAYDVQGHPLVTKQFFVSALTFIIPLCDTAIVVINRISKKQSPFVGGRDHTTHHLSYLGLSDQQVAIILTLISMIAMLLTYVIISCVVKWNYISMTLIGTFGLAVFGSLLYISRTSKPRKVNEVAARNE